MTDRVDRLVAYHAEYAAGVTDPKLAGWSGGWFKAEFPVEEAIAWAHHGFLPHQGDHLVAPGVTPGQARAIWDAADTITSTVDAPLTNEELARRILVLNEINRKDDDDLP